MHPKLTIMCIIMVLLLVPYLAAQYTEPESETIIRIQLGTTGSAVWVVESRIILATQEDEIFFEKFQKDETLKTSKLAEFKENMNLFLEKIKYSTQRSMDMTDFDIFLGREITFTKTYGVIQFQFVWQGFSVVENDTITMGDVFEGGYYLSKNEVLMIEFPENYTLVAVAPSPDHQRQTTLTWEGPLNFDSGQPSVVIKKLVVEKEEENEEENKKEEEENEIEKSAEKVPSEKSFPKEILALVLLGAALVIVILKFLTRKPKEQEPQKKSETKNAKKLLVDIIKDHGGAIAQKDLSELTGFSKSKVSLLLKDLKKEGVIQKKFKGRENLITLKE
jgi:uncharacterized membrane protein